MAFMNIFTKNNTSAGVQYVEFSGRLKGITGGRFEMAPEAAGYGLKIHTHLNSTGWGNEFKGEFVKTSGTMDGISAHYRLSASSTGVMRAISGHAYLDATYTLSGTSAAGSWISGVLGWTDILGVINGTAVTVTGTYGGLGACAGTLTACKYMSGVWADVSQLTKVPTSGNSQALLITGPVAAVAVNAAIYVDGPTYLTNFLQLSSAAGFAVAGATVAGTPSVKLTCKFGSTTFYLQGYDS
jgi:hypothetical protein